MVCRQRLTRATDHRKYMGMGISKNVWATHCSDPAQVLKVKWNRFNRALIVGQIVQTSDSYDYGLILSIAHKYLKNVGGLCERMWHFTPAN